MAGKLKIKTFNTEGMDNHEIARKFLDVNHLKQSYYAEGLGKSREWVGLVLSKKIEPVYADDLFGFEHLTCGLCKPNKW